LYPPIELENYLEGEIVISTFQVQEFNSKYCGYLCLFVLSLLSSGYDFEDIIFNLVAEFKPKGFQATAI